MAIVYEWDEVKAASNLAKHGVSFPDAEGAFADPAQIILDVTRTVDGEERLKVVGKVEGRLLAVVFTLRDEARRLISTRPTNRSEEKRYGDRQVRS